MKKFFEKNKKIIFIVSTILIILLVAFLLFKYFYKESEIYIELPTSDISYSFGPGGTTSTKFEVNKKVNLVIETNISKDKIKCYSSNEKIVKVDDNTSITALKNGLVEVYCKAGNTKSNIIEVRVGE